MSADCSCFRYVTARKSHQCEWWRPHNKKHPDYPHRFRRCEIKPGDYHEVCSGVSDGNPFRLRLCLFHSAICNAIWNYGTWNQRPYEPVCFEYSPKEHLDINNRAEWLLWLNRIRTEYRKLKSKL
jgi:hypothetical protein